jgi:hypothetical protein
MKQNKLPRNEYIIQPKGKTNPYRHDVIYSDLGQWKYPGQVTRIPSNQITMQGVNYPVQGVDNTGYSQMMYPGMNYEFPGQYVTEYPMAAYGGDPSLTNIEGHYPFGGQNTKTHTHMKVGGSLNRKVTCSNCGWSWRLSDGGTDPMTCHKCGGTIKMQNGGWLDTMQGGGDNGIDMSKVKMDYYPKSQAQAQQMLDENSRYEHSWNKEQETQKQKNITEAVKKGIPRKQAETQEVDQYNEGRDQGTFQQHTPQTKLSKSIEVLANPVTAMDEYVRSGYNRLPDNFSSNEEKDFLSPSNIANMGYQGLTGLGNFAYGLQSADDLDNDIKNKDYASAGIDAAFALPALNQIKKWTKKVPSQFTLKNASTSAGKMLNNTSSAKMLGLGKKIVPDAFSGNDAIEYVKALGKGTKDIIKNIPKTIKYSFDNYEDLQKLPNQYKNAIKEINTPEGLKRLKNLGVDDTDDFIKYLNNVQLNATMEGSHFFPVGPGSVNINPGQIKSLKKTILPLGSQENAIDHELGHAMQYYLENKGKTFNRLTDLDIEAVDELYPHVTEDVSNFLKNTTGMDYKSSKAIAKNLGESSSNYLFRNKREPLAHLRETKRAMLENGIINNIHEKITPEQIQKFISKGGDKDRILSFLQQTPEARKTLSSLLNRTPAIIPTVGAAGVLGADALQEKKDGGWLDDEYKRGGQKRKKYTSKNIQSSVNDLFRRNETLFGPAGKKRYKPGLKYKDGGNWLDNLH